MVLSCVDLRESIGSSGNTSLIPLVPIHTAKSGTQSSECLGYLRLIRTLLGRRAIYSRFAFEKHWFHTSHTPQEDSLHGCSVLISQSVPQTPIFFLQKGNATPCLGFLFSRLLLRLIEAMVPGLASEGCSRVERTACKEAKAASRVSTSPLLACTSCRSRTTSARASSTASLSAASSAAVASCESDAVLARPSAADHTGFCALIVWQRILIASRSPVASLTCVNYQAWV